MLEYVYILCMHAHFSMRAQVLGGASSAVFSLDCAVRKPLIATLGVDGCLRLWNYAEKRCEASKNYPHAPLSMALHPR